MGFDPSRNVRHATYHMRFTKRVSLIRRRSGKRSFIAYAGPFGEVDTSEGSAMTISA